MITYTTNDVAKQLNCDPRTVQKWCKSIGMQRHGRDYHLSEEDVEAFKKRPKPGPRKVE